MVQTEQCVVPNWASQLNCPHAALPLQTWFSHTMTENTIIGTTTLEMDPDYEYTIAARKKASFGREHPLFHAVGYQTIHKSKAAGFPFLEILLDLKKPEQILCRLILQRLDMTDNIAYVPSSLLPTWDAPKLSRVYAKLKQRGLVKRTMRHHYMVNPDAIFHPKAYPRIKKKWDSLP